MADGVNCYQSKALILLCCWSRNWSWPLKHLEFSQRARYVVFCEADRFTNSMHFRSFFEQISDIWQWHFCAKVVHFTQVAAFEAICGKASMDGSVVNFLKAHRVHDRHMTYWPRSILSSGLGGEQACTPSFAHDWHFWGQILIFEFFCLFTMHFYWIVRCMMLCSLMALFLVTSGGLQVSAVLRQNFYRAEKGLVLCKASKNGQQLNFHRKFHQFFFLR